MSRLLQGSGGVTYAQSGVDIDAGDEAVRRITGAVESTFRDGVLGSLGGFGGLFRLGAERFRDPVLVASADGVGTKLEIARLVGRYDTIGIDLVAMLVDDLACCGAEPLFVLDYVATGALDPARLAQIVQGVATGCRIAGAALLGGETAEHGGVMRPDDLDVAGFAIGVVEAGDELGPARVRDRDVLVGFASPGLRSNGYTLARKVLVRNSAQLDEPAWDGATTTLGDELLRPSVIYSPAIQALRSELKGAVHAAAHITGGGIVGNVPRALPDGLDAVIDMTSFDTPELFFEIQRRGPVDAEEMVRVFNCGLGMVVAVDRDAADAAVRVARDAGVDATLVGEVTTGARTVRLS
jgi:phosphoribosylformylglycinamidine cyclo-ligase